VFRPISPRFLSKKKKKAGNEEQKQASGKPGGLKVEKKEVKRRGGFGDLNGVGGVFLAHQITNTQVDREGEDNSSNE